MGPNDPVVCGHGLLRRVDDDVVVPRRLHQVRPFVALPLRVATNLGYRFYAHHLSRFYNCDWIIGSNRS